MSSHLHVDRFSCGDFVLKKIFLFCNDDLTWQLFKLQKRWDWHQSHYEVDQLRVVSFCFSLIFSDYRNRETLFSWNEIHVIYFTFTNILWFFFLLRFNCSNIFMFLFIFQVNLLNFINFSLFKLMIQHIFALYLINLHAMMREMKRKRCKENEKGRKNRVGVKVMKCALLSVCVVFFLFIFSKPYLALNIMKFHPIVTI